MSSHLGDDLTTPSPDSQEPIAAPSEAEPSAAPGTEPSASIEAASSEAEPPVAAQADSSGSTTTASSGSGMEVDEEEMGPVVASVGSVALLSAFTAMGLATWVQLALGRGFREEFLSKNVIPMEIRLRILIVILAAGGLTAITTAAIALLGGRKSGLTRLDWAKNIESWCWFLSPLMLMPATVVFHQSEVWFGKHETLLPIALFFGLILEYLVFKSLSHTPRTVREAFAPEPASTSRWLETLKRHGWLGIVVTAAFAYGLFMSLCAVRWHQMLGTATFDLGINNNLIFGGLHGKINQSTVIFPEDPQKYIANHVKLGLYLFLPIYWFFPRPETLLVIQSVLLGLGAIPLFLFARKRIPEWGAVLLALSYLAYYPMHGANFTEGNLVPVAAPFILALIWAVDSRYFKTTWVLFFVCILMREDIPIPLAVIGLVLALAGNRPRTGIFMFSISTVWFVVLRFKIMSDAGSWWFPNMYEDLWAAPYKGFGAVLHTLLTNPAYVLRHIFVEKKFWYLFHLMTPLVFLPVRRFRYWVAFVPGAIVTLLVTSYDPPVMYSFQYVMHWAPYLFIVAVLGIAAMGEDALKLYGSKVPRQAGAIFAVAFTSLALTYNYGAFPQREGSLQSGYHKIRFHWTEADTENLATVRKMAAMIPPEATVATTERIGPHFSSRIGFYTLRRGHHNVDFIAAQKSGLKLDRTRESIWKALNSKEYGVLYKDPQFLLLKKGADVAANEAAIKEWSLRGRTPRPRPSRLSDRDQDPADQPSESPEMAHAEPSDPRTYEDPEPSGSPDRQQPGSE